MPPSRYSMDKGPVNNYGRNLIDMCRNTNMFICNGRLGEDACIGKNTCQDVSLIDYVIASPMCLPLFCSFDVIDYSPLYSDVHCPVEFSLKADSLRKRIIKDKHDNPVHIENCCITPKPKRYDTEKTDLFQKNIDEKSLKKLYDTVELVNIGQNDIRERVNAIANDIAQVLCDSARATFGVRSTRAARPAPSHTRVDKPWFNGECRTMRKSYAQARRRFKVCRNIVNKFYFRQQAKLYKKCINKNVKRYKFQISKQLREQQKYNPRKFWQILNPKHNNDKTQSPSLSDF